MLPLDSKGEHVVPVGQLEAPGLQTAVQAPAGKSEFCKQDSPSPQPAAHPVFSPPPSVPLEELEHANNRGNKLQRRALRTPAFRIAWTLLSKPPPSEAR